MWALSALRSHHWLCYLGNTRVTYTILVRTISHYQCHSIRLDSPVIYSSFICQIFVCPLYFISRSKSSLWTPNYQDLFNFDGGGNWSARRKPPVRDPRRKSLLYGATYLVPWAGIELTPRTDIGYRPVSQARLNHLATTYPFVLHNFCSLCYIILLFVLE
jgi:hypothetical protein